MVKIIQNGNPVLREKTKNVPLGEIDSPKIKKIISNMKIALAREKDGVAIAAPQISESFSIFLVSDEIMKIADKDFKSTGKDLIFINPKITKLSREKTEVEEGCLSVRWKYGKVNRAVKASIRAYDETGKAFERGANGLLAQIFQHETEHLDGILFIDKAFDVKDMPPEEIVDIKG